MTQLYDLSKYDHVDDFLRGLGIEYANWSRKLMTKAALDRGLEVRKVESQRPIIISDGRNEYTWRGGNTTFNHDLARRLSNRKDATSKLLRSYGFSFPEGALFTSEESVKAWEWAQKLLPVVVKLNDGNQGRQVFVGIETRADFEQAFARVGEQSQWVVVEEMLPGTEHRCLVVNNKLVAVTRRRAASVVGDGNKTIAELVEEKNIDRGPIHIPLDLGATELDVLHSRGQSPDTVPHEGERVYLRRTSNIHTGGDAIDATDSLSRQEVSHIERLSRRFPGLRLGGFDVLLPRGPGEEGIHFIEINQAPMISMHHFPWEGEPRDVAGAIVDAMFPETAR